MKIKKITALLWAFVLVFSLCSCWEEEEDPSFWEEELTQESEVPTQSVQITDFTLPYLSGQTLDPVTCSDGVQQTVGALLYECLFSLNEDFSVQEVLCSSYQYDTETYTYTFSLRSGVTFSDGSALTASDVLAVYQRAAASERYAARFADVASMKLSGNDLVIKLTRANSAFPALLDIPIVKSGSEKSLVPLGTGPYLLITDAGEAYLMKNGEWWQQKALPLERILLVSAKDNDTATYLFSSHNVQLLRSDLTAARQSGVTLDADVTDCFGTTLLYLGYNVTRAPLNDAAVRSSFSTCIDRTQIITALLAGHALPTTFPISPLAALCPEQTAATAPSVYQNALANAGCSAEKPYQLKILVNEENSFKLSIANYLCRQLSCDFVILSVETLPWNDYLSALQIGNFDFYLGEIKLTADWNISSLIGSGGAMNYGGYTNADTDTLLAAFLADESTASAKAFCTQFSSDAPIAPIAFKSVSTMTSTGLISGMSSTVSDPFRNFSDWQFDFS